MKDHKAYYEGLQPLLTEYLQCPDELREIHLYNFIEHVLKQRDEEWREGVEQVIGEDEVESVKERDVWGDEHSYTNNVAVYKNELRTEQRQRLNQLLQGKEQVNEKH